ncbi:MAG TPA: hypothetical protein VF829_02165 [Candidatus Paceibacterota bacterium]
MPNSDLVERYLNWKYKELLPRDGGSVADYPRLLSKAANDLMPYLFRAEFDITLVDGVVGSVRDRITFASHLALNIETIGKNPCFCAYAGDGSLAVCKGKRVLLAVNALTTEDEVCALATAVERAGAKPIPFIAALANTGIADVGGRRAVGMINLTITKLADSAESRATAAVAA